ncbi:MAG: hypothetical protein AAF550_00215, partial [Myxococcota bacterium]
GRAIECRRGMPMGSCSSRNIALSQNHSECRADARASRCGSTRSDAAYGYGVPHSCALLQRAFDDECDQSRF